MKSFVSSKRIVVAIALALPLSASFAQAANPERTQKMAAELQKRFTAADANGDGRLTKDEAKGKMPFVFKHFDEIDTAHAGSISMADIAAYARAKHAERQ
jgi:hypothetical protein